MPLRWTRIDGVERSCSKESYRVSKRTGSTEAVQSITKQEAGASGVGRRAEEIPYTTFEGPIPSRLAPDPDDARDATSTRTFGGSSRIFWTITSE